LFSGCGTEPNDEVEDETITGGHRGLDLIYILTIDALRSDVIGLRHNGELVMPELTKFAKESVYFDHAYSQAPFTKISVASLFTGLWPALRFISSMLEPGACTLSASI